MANRDTLDYEPNDNDLMDEDAADASCMKAATPIYKLKSATSGGAAFAPEKTECRGFRREINGERSRRITMKESQIVLTISQFIAANERVLWGGFLLVFGPIFFGGFVYAAIISKLLPPSENSIILAIQNDRYYCFLVPLTLPVLVVAVYFHWLSMKMFKHA